MTIEGITEVDIVEGDKDKEETNVEVKSAKNLSFEEAFSKFTQKEKDQEAAAESPVDSDVPCKVEPSHLTLIHYILSLGRHHSAIIPF